MSRSELYQEEFHPSPLQHTWLEFKENHIAVGGLCCFIFILTIVLFCNILAPFDPLLQKTDAILIPPAWEPNGSIVNVFGTDALGRDLLSRVMYGCQMTFGISIILVLVAMLVGVSVGAVAGMSRGVRSSVVNHTLDSMMAIPTLLIAIIIIAILGTGLVNSMWAITLALTPQFIHQTRDFVRQERKKEYVRAAKLDGAPPTQIFIRSILPNMGEVLVVQGTLALSIAILDISALGFLNLGAQAPTAELGAMLSEGIEVAYMAPWSIALPGAAIFLMMLSINLVGDGLRSALRNRLLH
ncbi:MAG: ABC transporter permease subunit [Paraglaciecola sp.]|uniref:ABC transporter permease subunit n=1 Tax=Pseudomonadati TaxID=3379134 RepID=UPI00273CFE29|nr:ABC transporter permease subunit [Paraglaciecola sp.]MDP5030180.1 ABC transporter permease subunit [Paraglaciecola sp.]MDP5130770.1 ABC transporter permease subunit [Paraglaciecola sp.]